MKGSTLLMILIIVLLGLNLYVSCMNYMQLQTVCRENPGLRMNSGSLQPDGHASGRNARGRSSAEETDHAVASPARTIEVESGYRLENRYVISDVELPEYKGTEEGEVVLDIIVSQLGNVKSASLRRAAGIADEKVIEACKKAALKTDFNYDSDAGERESGEITYIFSVE